MLRTLSKGVNIPACAVSLLLGFNRIVSYRTMVRYEKKYHLPENCMQPERLWCEGFPWWLSVNYWVCVSVASCVRRSRDVHTECLRHLHSSTRMIGTHPCLVGGSHKFRFLLRHVHHHHHFRVDQTTIGRDWSCTHLDFSIWLARQRAKRRYIHIGGSIAHCCKLDNIIDSLAKLVCRSKDCRYECSADVDVVAAAMLNEEEYHTQKKAWGKEVEVRMRWW